MDNCRKFIRVFLVCSILLAGRVNAQEIQFEYALPTDEKSLLIEELVDVFYGGMELADIDGDQDIDVMIGGLAQGDFTGKIYSSLYLNDGKGNLFKDKKNIFEKLAEGDIKFADVDADGDLDILVTGRNIFFQQKAKLYLNQGSGEFVEGYFPLISGLYRSKIAFSDIDQDGDSDVVISGFAGYLKDPIFQLLLNDGKGSFQLDHSFPFENIAGELLIFDSNLDGKPDILSLGKDSDNVAKAYFYLNEGEGNFRIDAYSDIKALDHVTATAGDLNGDGYPDLIVNGRDSTLAPKTFAYLNDGEGHFIEHEDFPFEALSFASSAIFDVNADGRNDVLLIGKTNSNLLRAHLYLNEASSSFQEHNVEEIKGLRSPTIRFADLDGDQDSDVLVTGINAGGKVFTDVYENQGDANLIKVTNSSFLPAYINATTLGDLDGDDDLDIFLTGSDNISHHSAFYINDGQGNYKEINKDVLPSLGFSSAGLADIDQDQDNDLLMVGFNKYYAEKSYLYKNSGDYSFEAVSTPFAQGRGSCQVFFDADGDSDLDVVISASQFIDRQTYSITELYLNDGKGNFSLSSEEFEGSRFGGIAVADFNGDNTPDIAISGRNTAGNLFFKLYTNDGLGKFVSKSNSLVKPTVIGGLKAADFDQDGDKDLIITGETEDGTPFSGLYFNDGKGNFIEVFPNSIEAVHYSTVATADLNQDKLVDLIITGQNADKEIVSKVYQNVGKGAFTEVTDLPLRPVYRGTISVGDVDGDTDEDLFITGFDGYNPVSFLYKNVSKRINQPPVIECKALNRFLPAELCTLQVNPKAFDSGSSDPDGDPLTYTISPEGPFLVGTTDVVLTVSDGVNTASCTTSITVTDETKPEILTKTVTVELDENGQATITPEMVDNGSSDACGIASLSLSQTNFDCSMLGEQEVTLTATDHNGNEASATAIVLVEDNTAPVVLTQSITVELDENSLATISPEMVDNGSSDACGISSLSLSQTNFDCSMLGEQEVTLTAMDHNGNEASAVARVQVVDKTPPIVRAKPATLYLNEEGKAVLSTDMLDAGSYDECSVISSALSQREFNCADLGIQQVEYIVADKNGNTAFELVSITVLDQLVPAVTAEDIRLELNEENKASLTKDLLKLQIEDNCDAEIGDFDQQDFSCTDVGLHIIPVSVADKSGNYTSTGVNVEVVDPTPPYIDCPVDTLLFSNEPVLFLYGQDVQMGDNCGIQSAEMLSGLKSGSLFPLGTTQQSFLITDSYGNETLCSFNVTVSPVSGTKEEHESGFVVYPNPSNGKVYYSAQAGLQGITVYTLQGKKVHQELTSLTGELALEDLPKGTYILQFNLKDRTIQKQLILF